MARLPVFTVVDATEVRIHSTWFFEEHPSEWKALLAWCEAHGLDPHRMPSTGQTIVRDLARCRVVYDEYALTLDELHARVMRSLEVGEPARHRVHAQGETPPMPFPDEILAHLDPTRETA